MNWRKVIVVCILCVATVSIYATSHLWVVRFDGAGPIKIGMSLSQLNVVLHESFSMPAEKDDQACFYVNPAKHPGLGIMIEDGRVVRIDVERDGIATAEGIRVGDSEAHAMQVYGQKLKVESHAYTGPSGHYLTVRSSDGHYAIRFETDKGKFVRFYAGEQHAIAYIEGCQ
jgi:hypothetical protein